MSFLKLIFDTCELGTGEMGIDFGMADGKSSSARDLNKSNSGVTEDPRVRCNRFLGDILMMDSVGQVASLQFGTQLPIIK